MVWQVTQFDQNDVISGSNALNPYQSGACLALAMKWCVSKKKKLSSLHFAGLVATETQKGQIATWMKEVQDDPLADLFGNQKFKYYAGKKPIDSVENSTRGKVNNYQAYAYRLEKMSSWAKLEGLVLVDDKVGFPSGKDVDSWGVDLTIAALSSPPTIGLISLTGATDGHTMAFQHTRTPHEVINFFDPNHGEYRSTSRIEFITWFCGFISSHYSDLDQHWWVLKLA